MEVIRWDHFWEDYKTEFEQEANLPGGSLGEQAAEDLRQRVIEHVCIPYRLPWRIMDLNFALFIRDSLKYFGLDNWSFVGTTCRDPF